MPWTIGLAYLYGIATILLGIVGYVHAGSKASIISGGISGLIAIAGAVLAKQHPRVGFALVGLIALATLGRFGMTFVKTKHLYPDGVIVLLAVVGLVAAIGGFTGSGR